MLFRSVENKLAVTGQIKLVIFMGFFGAFTTFSTFAFETGQLLDDSQWLWAAGNLLLHTVAGLAALMAGLAIGKWI